MRIFYSQTGWVKGDGGDGMYRRVLGLTIAEKQMVKNGDMVIVDHNVPWSDRVSLPVRMVVWDGYKYVPRSIQWREDALEALRLAGWADDERAVRRAMRLPEKPEKPK